MIARIKQLLCKIGLHRWSKVEVISHHDKKKNIDIYSMCARCRKFRK